MIMARTDALAVEGMDMAIERARAYQAAGADLIFAEACTTLAEYKAFVQALDAPVLANITEFGKTPLFTVEELRIAGIAMVLYPLSAFRAMSAAALATYSTIRAEGTQAAVTDRMQTRAELYDVLNYHAYEQQIDSNQPTS
jgi:methylisocitrate lyase